MLELAQPASGDDPKSTSSALVGPTASSNPGTKFAPNKILPGVNSSAALYLRPRRGAGLLRPISALNSINPSPFLVPFQIRFLLTSKLRVSMPLWQSPPLPKIA